MATPSGQVEYPALTESAHHIPSKERVARMIEVNMGYAQCYMDGDFEGMLDYLIDVPVFEFHPQAIRVTGREAVVERSRRMFPAVSQNDSRTASEHEIRASTFAADLLIHEFSNVYRLADGTSRRCHTVAVIPFVGDKMVGERIYTDQYLAELRDHHLGPDFMDLPGVERL